MTKIARFQPAGVGIHSKGGVYKCDFCHKDTRETGEGESDLGLCADCYAKAGDCNSVSDGTMTREEYIAKWSESPEDLEHEA